MTSAGDGEYLPGAALETRVGSEVWITRTKRLIDRISAQAPAQRGDDGPDHRSTRGLSAAWPVRYQRFQCTTSSKGRRLGLVSGRSGRSAG